MSVNRKFVMESVQTNCDHDFVEYFKKVPNQKFLYTFRVVKPVKTFTISVVLRAVRSQRIMYKFNKLSGCQYLKKQIRNKFLTQMYQALVVNHSLFECPINPSVYFLKNMIDTKIVPHGHPFGYYQISIRVEMPQSQNPFVMEILSKYYIVPLK